MSHAAIAEDVAELAATVDGMTAALPGLDAAIQWLADRLAACGAMSDRGQWLRRQGGDVSTPGPDGWHSEDQYLRDVAEWRRLTAERAAMRAELAELTAVLESATVAAPAPVALASIPAPVARSRRRVRPAPRRRPAVRRRVTMPEMAAAVAAEDAGETIPPGWSFDPAGWRPVPVGRPPRSLGDWYVPSPGRTPNRARRAAAAVLAAILTALLWAAAAAVISLAWHGAPVLTIALLGTAASIATARKTNGRIAATIGRIQL